MKDENTEKEIERRVKKELATRDFLSRLQNASLDAVCGGNLTATDLIPILTKFTVIGYITSHGYDKKGRSFFKKSIENSWNDCVEEYENLMKEEGVDENDTDDLSSAKKFVMEILTEFANR